MIVYGAILSPFVRKVLMFAAEKGLEIENRPGGMGQGGDAFIEASPFGKMPAFRHRGAAADGSDYLLADSSAICAYLDAKYPDNPLIPAEPCARGECIWLDEFADTILMVTGGKMFFNRIVAPYFLGREGDLAAAAAAEAEELPRLLNWLDARLAGRDYFVGLALCLADVSVAVVLGNIKQAGGEVDAARYPNLARWLGAVEARPSLSAYNSKMLKIIDKITGAAVQG
ncbi:MAG: glutathione S-transferase family protein [Pseudomonadota bacterium]